MKFRVEIKDQAKKNFTGQYGISVGACLLFALLSGFTSQFMLGAFFIAPPMTVGYAYFSLRIYRGETGDIGEMFRVGFSNYWRNIGGILWMELFIFLWSLLFIIPGIVKALAYSMTPYILAEDENLPATEAVKVSMRMTQGYKGEIFVMALSFIGWIILTGLTFGLLGLLYTGPYMSTSFAGLYDELKQNAIANGTFTEPQGASL